MGRNSRHWQLQTPSMVMMAALAPWTLHQNNDMGMECEYSDVKTRWMKWTVSAKSGTSLDRTTITSIAMTLFESISFQNASKMIGMQRTWPS
jgi:hypothetical protein